MSISMFMARIRRAAPGLAAWRSNRPTISRWRSSGASPFTKYGRTSPVPQACSTQSRNDCMTSGSAAQGQSGASLKQAAVPQSVSEETRSGYVAAKSMHMGPPSEMPRSAACSLPAASMTARMSSIRSSKVGQPQPRSERPVPRLSKKINRENDARRPSSPAKNGKSHDASTWEMKPGTYTKSKGPSPTT